MAFPNIIRSVTLHLVQCLQTIAQFNFRCNDAKSYTMEELWNISFWDAIFSYLHMSGCNEVRWFEGTCEEVKWRGMPYWAVTRFIPDHTQTPDWGGVKSVTQNCDDHWLHWGTLLFVWENTRLEHIKAYISKECNLLRKEMLSVCNLKRDSTELEIWKPGSGFHFAQLWASDNFISQQRVKSQPSLGS